MAIFETLAKSVRYIDGNKSAEVTISKITDGDSNSDSFSVGESVTVTEDGVNKTMKFIGTVTVNGVEYPVVEIDLILTKRVFVVGLGNDDAPSNLPSLNTTDSFVVCFFSGTLIATPSGERKVEELASGDLVLVGDSDAIPATWLGRKLARAASIKWIGRQSVSTLFGPADRLKPVRFAAGSLGGGGATSHSA